MGVQDQTIWQRAIGNVVPIGKTASSLPSGKRPIASDPTTAEECRALRAWAENLPTSVPVPATEEQATRHLAFLASTLPSKNVDEAAGRMRFAVYLSMLRGYSDAALAHMSRRVCETLDWFPTPHQCLELAGEYRHAPSERVLALAACNRFDQQTFENWILSLSDGDEPNLDVPPFWIESALTRTLLRKLDDGTVVTRAKYRAINRIDTADAS